MHHAAVGFFVHLSQLMFRRRDEIQCLHSARVQARSLRPLTSSKRQLLSTNSALPSRVPEIKLLSNIFSAQEGPHMLMSHLAGAGAGQSTGSHCCAHGQMGMAPTALLLDLK